MMKKKNMAIAMAAVTVASSVAPAFAAAKEEDTYVISNDQSSKLVAKVRELLKVKYTESEDAVYTITAKYTNKSDEKKDEPIKTSAELVKILGEAKGNVVVKIVDNGHAKSGDKIVDEAIKTYKDDQEVMNLAGTDVNLVNKGALSAKYDANKKETTIKIGATAEYAKTFTIKAGHEQIKTTDDNMYVKYNKAETPVKTVTAEIAKLAAIDNADDAITQANAPAKLKSVTDLLAPALNFDLAKSSLTPAQKTEFGKLKTDLAGLIKTADESIKVEAGSYNAKATADAINAVIAKKADKNLVAVNEEAILSKVDGLVKAGLQKIDPIEYQVTVSDEKIYTTKASTLFDGLMLTDKGNELLEVANKGIKKDKKDYNKVTITTKDIEKKDKDKYELEIAFSLATGTVADGKVEFTVKVEDTKEKDLAKLQAIFTKVGDVVSGPEAYKLAGDNRYRTAVEISEASYPKASADNKAVVLVGADAIVDGLAAAPLAKELKAPVLLTGKDSLRTEVEKEIKRLLVDDTKVSELKDKTVYLVGGESVIGKGVVNQLTEMGITVERVAGLNREETSLAVAEKLEKVNGSTSIDKAFVVGGYGEADAMSIAAFAAEKGNPIIVSKNANTLTKETKKFLDEKAVDIIGGETVVSAKVESELSDMKINVNRVKGQNRQETNANVIKKYYKNGVKYVYVAKDGAHGKTDQLIDALSVAPLAAKDGNVGPIVLATNGLSDDQVDAVELKASAGAKLVQVGHGVVETVVNKIATIVGLK